MFANRAEAGRRLAERLLHLMPEPVVVLGLPRGGVPVAFEVAEALHAPLDVIVVRKLGVPFQPELAMGAIGEGGTRVLNDDIVRMTGVTDHEVAEVESRERAELARRAARFRGDAPPVDLSGRTAVIVDDGVATGATARAACRIAKARGASRVVLAVPVAPAHWRPGTGEVDEFVCVTSPADFWAIGQFYRDFRQTADEQVIDLLRRAGERTQAGAAAGGSAPRPEAAAPAGGPVRDEAVEAVVGHRRLRGHLTIPADAIGLVVFAHGSGSSHQSPRNRYVSSLLNEARLGTLLFDLLSEDEQHDRDNVFDVDMLAVRLEDLTRWARSQPEVAGLPIGYFGASTGAAAALCAASKPEAGIAAVVSRGGRPDLAWEDLPRVTAPTLLVVGGADHVVLDLNREAATRLTGCEWHIEVIPGATHLFDEPGTLRAAGEAARDWFVRHLPPSTGSSAGRPSRAASIR